MGLVLYTVGGVLYKNQFVVGNWWWHCTVILLLCFVLTAADSVCSWRHTTRAHEKWCLNWRHWTTDVWDITNEGGKIIILLLPHECLMRTFQVKD